MHRGLLIEAFAAAIGIPFILSPNVTLRFLAYPDRLGILLFACLALIPFLIALFGTTFIPCITGSAMISLTAGIFSDLIHMRPLPWPYAALAIFGFLACYLGLLCSLAWRDNERKRNVSSAALPVLE